MKRRKFIQIGTLGGVTLQFPGALCINFKDQYSDLPKRVLGRTGERISILGFGGIALRNNGQDFANEVVAEAFDAGINYFDIAPSYGDSQALLGPALQSYRNKVYLACKTGKRDKAGAGEELHESLRQLKTDHFDVYQFHGLSKMEDVEQIFGPSGAIETFIRARKEGKIRYIGFSAHSEEVALKAMELFDFDTILYPINCVCWHNGKFGPRVFETARKKDMGILAIKAVAREPLGGNPRPYPNMWYKPFEEYEQIVDALRFTLSKDIAATVHAGDVKFMYRTIQMIRSADEIGPPDQEKLLAMIKGIEPIFTFP